MADALWTPDAIVEAIAGDMQGSVTRPMDGVSIDSRSVASGDVFFAIKGDRLDGHEYVIAAFDAGAALAVVSDADEAMSKAGPLMVVDDTLRALEQLGAAARRRCRARVVAITGSVGKTSSKEAMRLCLAGQGKVHASAASYNNHWGVPLTLSRLPADADFGIFEVGMNHPGEIVPLTQMIQPHVAVITTVEAVHIGAFASVEEIADAKAEVFQGVQAGGTAVLNMDNAHFDRLSAAARAAGIDKIISFGTHERADARLTNLSLRDDGSCVMALIDGQDITYKLGAPGQHLVLNSLAVLAAVTALGGDLALAALALADVRPAKGRGARCELVVNGGNLTLIDESYNANPASMRAALALLGMAKPGRGGRRIAVLGDMLELGAQSATLHADLLDSVVGADTDMVFACGEGMAALWDGLEERRRGQLATASDGLEVALLETVRSGDVIMVKGSLGSRMGRLVDALRNRYKVAKPPQN